MESLYIMRQELYKNILKSYLIPQNGFKTVLNYLRTIKKILTFCWPANSPHMNPIESVWECLKQELAKEQIATNLFRG